MSVSSSDARVLSRPVLLVAGILCIAMALRAPVTGVAPLIGMIRAQLGLSSTAAGMLITLPLLAFAGGSLAAAGLARRYGLERTLFGALLLIAAGIVGRSLGSEAALYAGTLVIGAGIALGNVLLPSLVKRDFPQRVAGLTSAYVLTMSVIAGVASAVAIPLAMLSDATWRFRRCACWRCRRWAHCCGCRSCPAAQGPRPSRRMRRTASGCGAARWPGRSRCSWASIPSCSMQW